MRVASLLSIALYAAFALIALDAAGVVEVLPGLLSNIGIWVLTVYGFVGVLMNAISRSRPERLVMTPVALMLALFFLTIALGV
jgi:uncharacterized membrane protein YeiB